MEEVLLIFDLGKTNKKVLLFNRELGLLHQEESRFNEVADEDGFPCDDVAGIALWILDTLRKYEGSGQYRVAGVNFTTYGASLIYLDRQGRRLTPLYNYLKPFPELLLEGFFDPYGGRQEFSRRTASPILGMLNSGLQVLWLKRTRPGVFSRVDQVLHLPQYLAYLVSGKIVSEHTSIGCHTGMWDFDAMSYHSWLREEGIRLPGPVPVSETTPVPVGKRTVMAGIGLHDSSASLAPYILASGESFILVSTGTWCITMNPFNHEPLKAEELERDCLCYLGVNMKPVKSSRFFLGRIHDLNVERIAFHFQVEAGTFTREQPAAGELRALWNRGKWHPRFFREGVPEGYLDTSADLSRFRSFHEAYAALMGDLTRLVVESVKRVIAEDDRTDHLYITGGFARNPFFTGLMCLAFQEKCVFTSQVDNAASLGAAMVITGKVWQGPVLQPGLGLKRVLCK